MSRYDVNGKVRILPPLLFLFSLAPTNTQSFSLCSQRSRSLPEVQADSGNGCAGGESLDILERSFVLFHLIVAAIIPVTFGFSAARLAGKGANVVIGDMSKTNGEKV